MSVKAPALRFLLLVLGGWTAARGYYVAGSWTAPAVAPLPAVAEATAAAEFVQPFEASAVSAHGGGEGRHIAPPVIRFAGQAGQWVQPGQWAPPGVAPLVPATASDSIWTSFAYAPAEAAPQPEPEPNLAQRLQAWQPAPLASAPGERRSGRWSASAWALMRQDQELPSLAAGGMLGGSQAGMRIAYRFNNDAARPLSLVARGYMPINDPSGAEAAMGIEWQPLRQVPIRLLAERRQALGSRARSDFAFLLHGGVSDVRLPADFRLEAYGQAGGVGTADIDLFADGFARLSLPLGSERDLRIGGGIWGATQPGLSRLDIGPQASMRLPFVGSEVRLIADWRFRVAGDAEPGSGPALTIASDF